MSNMMQRASAELHLAWWVAFGMVGATGRHVNAASSAAHAHLTDASNHVLDPCHRVLDPCHCNLHPCYHVLDLCHHFLDPSHCVSTSHACRISSQNDIQLRRRLHQHHQHVREIPVRLRRMHGWTEESMTSRFAIWSCHGLGVLI